MALVTAYRKRDGKKVRIPEHWLGHKVLGKPFRKTRPAAKPEPIQYAPAASSETATGSPEP